MRPEDDLLRDISERVATLGQHMHDHAVATSLVMARLDVARAVMDAILSLLGANDLLQGRVDLELERLHINTLLFNRNDRYLHELVNELSRVRVLMVMADPGWKPDALH